MTAPEISDEVLTFLREHFDGFDDVEVLLLIRSEAPAACTRSWIVSQLRLPEPEIDASLDHLVAAGLLGRDAERRYVLPPAAPELRAKVDALAQIYAQRPTVIMRILNRLALDRVRSRAARAFAHAFVIGKRRRDKDG